MLLLLEIIGLIIAAGAWWYINDRRRYAKYPPGPPRLPIIGNAHQIMKMSSFPATAFQKLGNIYGDVMFLKMGMNEAVVFNERDVIHEMLTHEKTTNRTQFEFVKERHNNKNLGIIWGYGKPWQELRRYTMRNLREFGYGKSATMDAITNDELDKFVAYLQGQLSQSPNSTIEVDDLFSLTVVNVLWRLMSGQAYEYDDPRMIRLFQLNGDFFRSVNMGFHPSEAFPFLRKWFPNWSKRTLQMESCQALYDYGKELLDEQQKELRMQDTPSFINVFGEKVEECKGTPDTVFNDEQFVMTIVDLVISGSETIGNTLAFGVLYMLLNPEVQEKVQKEIDLNIPSDNPIESDMKSRLPYTSATILEMYRYSTVIPTPAAREATEDFYFRGHFIRKGMSLKFNLYGAHFSEKAFGDPINFRPERFLNPSGTEIDQKAVDKLEIFGAGKRFCVGQSLTEPVVFVYFASLLRKFKFVKVDGTNPTTAPVLGITTLPHRFPVQVLERQPNSS